MIEPGSLSQGRLIAQRVSSIEQLGAVLRHSSLARAIDANEWGRLDHDDQHNGLFLDDAHVDGWRGQSRLARGDGRGRGGSSAALWTIVGQRLITS